MIQVALRHRTITETDTPKCSQTEASDEQISFAFQACQSKPGVNPEAEKVQSF